jgi:hypothetical protein
LCSLPASKEVREPQNTEIAPLTTLELTKTFHRTRKDQSPGYLKDTEVMLVYTTDKFSEARSYSTGVNKYVITNLALKISLPYTPLIINKVTRRSIEGFTCPNTLKREGTENEFWWIVQYNSVNILNLIRKESGSLEKKQLNPHLKHKNYLVHLTP